MRLLAILAPVLQLLVAVRLALLPTLKDIYDDPGLLVSPKRLSQVFFAHVWLAMSAGIDAEGDALRRNLLTPATGVVMDVGAGHGHSIAYMDLEKVTTYVAVEPNKYMHAEIRQRAAAHGFTSKPGDSEGRKLIIISVGAEQLDLIKARLEFEGIQGVDTIISLLTFCSVPDAAQVLPRLFRGILKPGGSLIFWEHVKSHRADVAFWQKFWSPIWGIGFDGCRLDIPSDIIVHNMKSDDGSEFWSEKKHWGMDGDNVENLWWHQVGHYTRL